MTTDTAPTKKRTTKRPTMPDTPTTSAAAPLEALVGDLPTGHRMVDLDQLIPHPRNPRTDVTTDLQALADSIRAQGVRQNLLVVPDPGDPGRHMIVIGHRRAAAARMAGLVQVPAIVDPSLSEAQQLELMLVENMQRSDLTVVEEGAGYQGLLDLGLTRAQMATATGASKSTVASRLRVAGLPEAARSKLHVGQGTLADVERLAAFEDEPETYAALVNHLGTGEFAWRVGSEEGRRRQRLEAERLTAAIAEHNIPVVESYSDLPAGVRTFVGSGDRAMEYFEKQPGDALDRFYALARSYPVGAFDLYECTPAEGGAAGRESDTEADAEAERNRRLFALLTADVQTATDLRTAFLVPLCRGEQRLTAEQSDVVVRHMATELLDEMFFRSQREVVADWMGLIDLDDPDDLTRGSELEPGHIVNDAIATGQLYLALLAAETEFERTVTAEEAGPYSRGIRTVRGAREGWGSDDEIVAWYALLEQLGYQPSAWEQDRLAGRPLPDYAAQAGEPR